ncbi:MAG: NAD(P)H-binding protein [Bacillota bacterium]|jgi:NADH dehydrogenase
MPGELNVVTGAFGYTGKYITRHLLARGKDVLTLTGRPGKPNPFGQRVTAVPYKFDRPGELAKSMQGATTLFNTYWVRFPYAQTNYDQAVKNTLALIRAAEEAGLQRIVHISIANASPASPLPYFKGKGLLEEAIARSSLSYAILRPTVIFGPEDILINNIAWLLRRFPLFAVPGKGDYRLQPVFVEDMADLAVRTAGEAENIAIDAVGPEVFTFNELVRLIREVVRSRAGIVHLNPDLALYMSSLVGLLVNDVVLTRDEVEGLMANLLVSGAEPTGQTRLSSWLKSNKDSLGATYASELSRHYR